MRRNQLTYFLSNYNWFNSYTLYQIITYLIFKFSNLIGLTFASGLIMTFAYFLFTKINQKIPKINFLAFLIISWFGWNVFYLGFRSQVFTFTGLVIVFLIIKKIKQSPKLLLLLPPIFTLWVNLHGGFILGLALLALAILPIALGISFLATLINPYGLGVYQEAFRHIQFPLGGLIAEWVSPSTIIKIVLVSLTVILLPFIFERKNKKKIFWSIALILFALLAYQSKRNLPFFALTASLAFLETFNKQLISLEKNVNFEKVINFILIAGIPFLIFTSVFTNYAKATVWNNYCTQGILNHPCEAVEFVKENNIKGENVFSAYEWGGFLEWQLPEYKFFVDGRMPAWPTQEGKSPYTIYLEIIQAQPDYQERLDNYQTDWLLISTGSFLDIELSQNPNTPWKEIYRDNVASIYVHQ